MTGALKTLFEPLQITYLSITYLRVWHFPGFSFYSHSEKKKFFSQRSPSCERVTKSSFTSPNVIRTTAGIINYQLSTISMQQKWDCLSLPGGLDLSIERNGFKHNIKFEEKQNFKISCSDNPTAYKEILGGVSFDGHLQTSTRCLICLMIII